MSSTNEGEDSMNLTLAQLQAIKADIAANNDLNVNQNTEDGNAAIAALYNLVAVAAFIVWKSSATIQQIGTAFDATELAGLTTGNSTRLQTLAMYFAQGVNPSIAGIRQFFSDVFSGAGGANTTIGLNALWRRSALRIEKLFATGTGTTASPATLVIEGKVTSTDILNARNS